MSPAAKWAKRLVSLLLLVGTVLGVYWVVLHKQDVIDWWRLKDYQPSATVKALADATTMHGRGRDLFYVSSPQINERDDFNQNCTDTGEESLVLGCYHFQQIFIYNVSDERLNGVKEVTAAHEMLHAAYERLSGGDRAYVDGLLQARLNLIKDERLSGLIDLYNQEEPGQLLNELHSILGTEFANLGPELEAYYKQYFVDRAKIVAFAQKYETTFTDSKNRIADYDKQLETLQSQVKENSTKLDQQKANIDAQAAQLDFLRSNDPSAYNKAVPGYNAAVRAFNILVAQTRSLIEQYNELVQKRNNEVASQNDLLHSLDSTYQQVQADN